MLVSVRCPSLGVVMLLWSPSTGDCMLELIGRSERRLFALRWGDKHEGVKAPEKHHAPRVRFRVLGSKS